MLHLVQTLDGDAARGGHQVDGGLGVQTAGLKQLHGTLVSYDEASFVLRTEGGKDHTIQRKDAALIRPYIEF